MTGTGSLTILSNKSFSIMQLYFLNLKRIPIGIQTHTPSILKCLTSWEESNLRRLRNLTLPSRERVYLFRHGKLKNRSQRKSIMVWTTRVNYSLVVSYPRYMNMSIYARTYGCSEPIAGYLPWCPWSCFLTPQSISRYL